MWIVDSKLVSSSQNWVDTVVHMAEDVFLDVKGNTIWSTIINNRLISILIHKILLESVFPLDVLEVLVVKAINICYFNKSNKNYQIQSIHFNIIKIF